MIKRETARPTVDELSESRAHDALADFDDLPVVRWAASEPLRRRAFGLRHNLWAYDAAYVALARRWNARSSPGTLGSPRHRGTTR